MKRWPTAIVGGGRGGWCGTVVVSVFERTGEASPACRRTPAQHRERTFSLSVLRMVGGRTAGKVVGTVQAFSLRAAFRIAVRIPSVS